MWEERKRPTETRTKSMENITEGQPCFCLNPLNINKSRFDSLATRQGLDIVWLLVFLVVSLCWNKCLVYTSPYNSLGIAMVPL